MFSIPVSTAIGDDTYFFPKPARKDVKGGIITDLRTSLIKKYKKGHIDDVLFSKPFYVTICDSFKEANNVPKRVQK